ncbi:ABC transporter permease subunit [Pseudooceanicola sp. GBMRC 2024]|uniref:ABC transporter permease subunit n=1 Tax=Pseudooceanicola albus TaxID=2692189 RepID=A0A6L7G3D1_9RHOB|nr:ABC transporter permease [Pseudooceanicola albus]MXN17890.1 ABC transporter permease subunit [Pseudooceanicola albus]
MRGLFIIGRTTAQSIPTMLGIIVISFILLHLMPGDAVDAIVGMSGSASKETVAQLRETYGLDQSLPMQFWNYLSGVFQLNLGTSISYSAPVLDVILERLPATLTLMLCAFVLALAGGIVIGWAMAVFAGRWPDRLLTAGSLLLYSAPNFWVGLMIIVLFSAKLQWFPSSGDESIGAGLTGWAWFLDRAHHLVLPSCALAAFFVAIYARLTRAAMLEVLRQDYIRTARAKGLHPMLIQFRHGLRNALIPVTTVAGLHLGNLLGGAVVVETVFNWPGLGRLTMNALAARDTQVLLGILLLSSVAVILTNLLIDWLVTWLDPRIRS